MGRVGSEGLADAGHFAHGGVEVGMQAEADGGDHGGAEPAGFVEVGPLGGQVEDVGGDLHRGVALRAAAGDAHAFDAAAAAALDALPSFAQGVGQAFEDGAVKVGAGMRFAEADHGALGLGAGQLDAGVPVGLQHQAQRPGRHGLDQIIEEGLGGDAERAGLLLLMQAELFLEPVHHPEATRDLDLGVVATGHGGGVGRDEARGFQVAWRADIDGGGGAVGQAGALRRQAAGAEHLAGLVGGAGDQWQALGDARVLRGGGAHRAQARAGGDELRQHVAPDRQHLPFPVPGMGPAPAPVVEGNVADLAGDRVGKTPAEAPVEVAREQQVFVGARPELGLMLRNPVGLGFAREVADSVAHVDRAQRDFPPWRQLRIGIAAPLVEPDDGRAQWPALDIEVDHGGALGGEHHAADGRLGHAGVGPQVLAGLAQGAPEVFGIAFHPARLGCGVAVERHLRLVDQMTAEVEHQRTHALRAAIDGEEVVAAHAAFDGTESCRAGVRRRGWSGSVRRGRRRRGAVCRRAAGNCRGPCQRPAACRCRSRRQAAGS